MVVSAPATRAVNTTSSDSMYSVRPAVNPARRLPEAYAGIS
jgi:hypothetical protein